MNSDLISRSALLADIQADVEEGGLGGMVAGALKRYVKRAPAVEVAPVRHGRWIISSDGYYPYCSECKEEPKSGNMTKYCPNCGAKMDGGAADADSV